MALVKNEKARRGEIRWGHEVYCDSLGARHEFSHPCKAFHKTTLQWTLQFSDGSGSKLPRHSSLSQTPLSRFVHSRDVNATSVHSRYTLTGSTHSHDTSTITTGMYVTLFTLTFSACIPPRDFRYWGDRSFSYHSTRYGIFCLSSNLHWSSFIEKVKR